jgi:hypothetical protein
MFGKFRNLESRPQSARAAEEDQRLKGEFQVSGYNPTGPTNPSPTTAALPPAITQPANDTGRNPKRRSALSGWVVSLAIGFAALAAIPVLVESGPIFGLMVVGILMFCLVLAAISYPMARRNADANARRSDAAMAASVIRPNVRFIRDVPPDHPFFLIV